jgi:tetratricopeptide (TPR) repeat protein
MRKSTHTHRLATICLVVAAGSLSAAGASADTLTLWNHAKPPGTFSKALDLLARGNLKEADAIFQQIAADDPAQVYAVLGHAQVAVAERNLDQADRAVTSVLSRDDRLPEAHNLKGVVLLLRQKPDEARREFAQAIKLRPTYVTPRVYLAAMMRATKDYAHAAEQYKSLTDVAPRVSTGYVGQAEAEMMSNHPAQAIEVLRNWKRRDPKNAMPSQVLASLLVVTGETQRAIAELKDALALDPRDSTTLRIMGDAYRASEQTQRGLEQYRAALAADSRNIPAHLGLGMLLLQTGDTEGARTIFKKILDIDATNPIACNNIAWLLIEEGTNLPEARRLAQLAVKTDPEYVDAYDTLGWTHYRLGEYSQAVDVLKKARTLAPDRPDIAGHLGLAYAKIGSKETARGELKRALASRNSPAFRASLERALADLSTGPQ